MADGSAIKGSEDAMQRCNELEAELAELRGAYEQYFMGNDRLPPSKKHDGFKKQFMKLKSSSVRQTAAKFRIETIGQKLLTFERLWDRTVQQIEAGTYKRDLMRLKRHQKQVHKPGSADSDFDVDEDLDLSDLDEGGDDLASALAAASASAAARAPAPVIKPVPSRVEGPVTGLAPATAPVAPTLKPVVTPSAGLQPLTAPIPAGRPVGPPRLTAAIPTGVSPAFKPASSAAERPVITAPVPAGATGSNPALRAATGVSAALRPAGATGSNPAPPRPPTAAGGEGGLSDTKVKAIYDAYVMAKKRCGEDTRAVTLDSVASSLRKQVPELMKTHNAKTVEFKVVIKDGKAVLRALPKD